MSSSDEDVQSNVTTKKTGDEEVGWEDWDEDHRRALGKAHLRVLASLQDFSSSDLQSESRLTPFEVEEAQKEGENEPRRRYYLHSQCLVLFSVGLLAVVGATVAVFTIPQGVLTQQQVLFQDFSLTAAMLDFMGHNPWVPPEYDGLYSDVNQPIEHIQPVLWTMPRSGSLCLMDILSYCGKLVISNGAARGREQEQSLVIFTGSDNVGHFANADTTTLEGLKAADHMSLIESDLVQVLATPHLPEASQLFKHKVKSGRIFAIFRDPVERAVSDYHFLKTLDPKDPLGLPQTMSLSQFVESDQLITNPLTKILSNITDDTIVEDVHVTFAKQLIQEKIVVGLADSFEESLSRYLSYFGWVLHDPVCATNFKAARDKRDTRPKLGSEEENETLRDRNWADMEIFEFAKVVFESQRVIQTMTG